MPTNRIIDLRRRGCPGPIIDALRIIDRAKKGDVIIFLVDKGECTDLLLEFLSTLDVERIETMSEDDYVRVIVRV